MDRLTKNSSYLLGCAYFALAVISLTVPLPVRTINCFAIGAVCFSFSELLQAIRNLKVYRKSTMRRLCEEINKGKQDIAAMCLTELIEEKQQRLVEESSKPSFFIFAFRVLAFFFIIAYPYTKYSFLENERIGIFCTIFSLGVIFLSSFVSDIQFMKREDEDELAFLKGIETYLNSSTRQLKKIEEAVDSKLQNNTARKKSDEPQGDQKKRKKRAQKTKKPRTDD